MRHLRICQYSIAATTRSADGPRLPLAYRVEVCIEPVLLNYLDMPVDDEPAVGDAPGIPLLKEIQIPSAEQLQRSRPILSIATEKDVRLRQSVIKGQLTTG